MLLYLSNFLPRRGKSLQQTNILSAAYPVLSAIWAKPLCMLFVALSEYGYYIFYDAITHKGPLS